MREATTYAVVLELKHRLESFLYDGEQDSMLEDSDIDLAENVYFLWAGGCDSSKAPRSEMQARAVE